MNSSFEEPLISTSTGTQSVPQHGAQVLPTTVAHRGFTLITFAFPVYGFFFLTLYTQQFWFGVNLIGFGIPAVLVAIALSHFLLRWQESPLACKWYSPIGKGYPRIVYWNWVSLNQPGRSPGFQFGNRYFAFSSIDEIGLTLFGNLVVRSWKLSGNPYATTESGTESGAGVRNPSQTPRTSPILRPLRNLLGTAPRADLIVKLPFGFASASDQKELINNIRAANPAVVINKRLHDRLETKEVKGTALVQQLGAVFLCLVLLDLGDSSTRFLEILKCYYQSQVDARTAAADAVKRAQDEYNRGNDIRLHPLPISWVSTILLKQGLPALQVLQAQAEAAWYLGKKDEAIEAIEKTQDLSPKSLRYKMIAARWLAETGKQKEAQTQIQEALAHHKDSFLPGLYMLALKTSPSSSGTGNSTSSGTGNSTSSGTGNSTSSGTSNSTSSATSALTNNKDPQTDDVIDPDGLTSKELYDRYMDKLDQEVFGEEPVWPPGGNRFLHDVWYRDDVTFVFDRLFKAGKFSNKR